MIPEIQPLLTNLDTQTAGHNLDGEILRCATIVESLVPLAVKIDCRHMHN